MKRFSWGMVAAVAITGLAWLGTSPAASGQTIGTTINTTVGHSLIRGLGSGATFGVASCNSSAPSTVACDIWNTSAVTPRDTVRIWCLAPTAPGGATLTISYTADGSMQALPSTTLKVNCAAPPVTNMPTPGHRTLRPLTGRAPFGVTGCTTDVFGATCTFSGAHMKEVCQVDATTNVLPIMVHVTVKLSGAPVIAGKTIMLPFECN